MKSVPILYEDENFLIFNKPAGLPVQGGKGIKTSLDTLLAQCRKERPLLVHRLDKDTSGVIVTAKTTASAAACSAFFSGQKQGLKKNYLAFCAGLLNESGIINEKITIKGKGKTLNAETFYTRKGSAVLIESGEKEPVNVSLAEIMPFTGRMHQIRRHLAQSGHPILGDDKYGDFALNKTLKKTLGIKKLLLHALSIYLPSPLIKGGLEITAPLPDYFRELIEKTGIKQ